MTVGNRPMREYIVHVEYKKKKEENSWSLECARAPITHILKNALVKVLP